MSKIIISLIVVLFTVFCGNSLGSTKLLSDTTKRVVVTTSNSSVIAVPKDSVVVDTTKRDTVKIPAINGGNIISAPIDEPMDRVERRHLKAQKFAQHIDSLITSRSYLFMPNSMQEMPNGWLQLIYNQCYYIGILNDHAEVHMPLVKGGVIPYLEVINFDTFYVKGYQTSRTQFGWCICYNLKSHDDTIYTINMVVYNMTGECIVTLLSSRGYMRYVGTIEHGSKRL